MQRAGRSLLGGRQLDPLFQVKVTCYYDQPSLRWTVWLPTWMREAICRVSAANPMPTTPSGEKAPAAPQDQRGGTEINISVRAMRYPPFLPQPQHPPVFTRVPSHCCHHDHNLSGDEVGAADRSEFWLPTMIILNDHNSATHLHILLPPILLAGIVL